MFDVDRTLFNSKHRFPRGIKQIFADLTQQGLMLGVCTGRGYQALDHTVLPLFRETAPTAKHVICNGAAVVDNHQQVFFQQPIPGQLISSLLKLLDYSERIVLSSLKTSYLNSPYYQEFKPQWSGNVQLLEDYNGEDIFVVNARGVEADFLKGTALENQLDVKYMRTTQADPSCDITMPGVNKGAALKQWSEITKIPLSQVIVFGDSENDLDSFQVSGLRVAMGNATEKLKAAADIVIGDVDDDGLSKFLGELLE